MSATHAGTECAAAATRRHSVFLLISGGLPGACAVPVLTTPRALDGWAAEVVAISLTGPDASAAPTSTTITASPPVTSTPRGRSLPPRPLLILPLPFAVVVGEGSGSFSGGPVMPGVVPGAAADIVSVHPALLAAIDLDHRVTSSQAANAVAVSASSSLLLCCRRSPSELHCRAANGTADSPQLDLSGDDTRGYNGIVGRGGSLVYCSGGRLIADASSAAINPADGSNSRGLFTGIQAYASIEAAMEPSPLTTVPHPASNSPPSSVALAAADLHALFLRGLSRRALVGAGANAAATDAQMAALLGSTTAERTADESVAATGSLRPTANCRDILLLLSLPHGSSGAGDTWYRTMGVSIDLWIRLLSPFALYPTPSGALLGNMVASAAVLLLAAAAVPLYKWQRQKRTWLDCCCICRFPSTALAFLFFVQPGSAVAAASIIASLWSGASITSAQEALHFADRDGLRAMHPTEHPVMVFVAFCAAGYILGSPFAVLFGCRRWLVPCRFVRTMQPSSFLGRVFLPSGQIQPYPARTAFVHLTGDYTLPHRTWPALPTLLPAALFLAYIVASTHCVAFAAIATILVATQAVAIGALKPFLSRARNFMEFSTLIAVAIAMAVLTLSLWTATTAIIGDDADTTAGLREGAVPLQDASSSFSLTPQEEAALRLSFLNRVLFLVGSADVAGSSGGLLRAVTWREMFWPIVVLLTAVVCLRFPAVLVTFLALDDPWRSKIDEPGSGELGEMYVEWTRLASDIRTAMFMRLRRPRKRPLKSYKRGKAGKIRRAALARLQQQQQQEEQQQLLQGRNDENRGQETAAKAVGSSPAAMIAVNGNAAAPPTPPHRCDSLSSSQSSLDLPPRAAVPLTSSLTPAAGTATVATAGHDATPPPSTAVGAPRCHGLSRGPLGGRLHPSATPLGPPQTSVTFGTPAATAEAVKRLRAATRTARQSMIVAGGSPHSLLSSSPPPPSGVGVGRGRPGSAHSNHISPSSGHVVTFSSSDDDHPPPAATAATVVGASRSSDGGRFPQPKTIDDGDI